MNKLLIRLFVKNWEHPQEPKVRSAVGRLSGITGIVCNALLSAGKLIIGAISGSVSITADAMNNLTDAASAIVTLIGFKLAEKPADKHHPYGHARFEYLSGLAVAALILVIGVELGRSSLMKIIAPSPVAFSLPLVIVLAGSIAVKLWLSLFNRTLGKHIDSGALLATAADSRNDVISTSAVLVAALIERFTGLQIDGFMGLAVSAFIIFSGITLGKETISPLLGEAASPELRQYIIDTVTSNCCVLGWHDLMVHDYGPGQRFASMHVEMDQKEDPLFCHELIDDLERLCHEKHNVHLVIHYDPVVIGDSEQDRLKGYILGVMAGIDTRLTLHDLRMVRGKGHTNLIFDIALPEEMLGRKDEIKEAIDNALAALGETRYYTVITFDLEAFNV